MWQIPHILSLVYAYMRVIAWVRVRVFCVRGREVVCGCAFSVRVGKHCVVCHGWVGLILGYTTMIVLLCVRALCT